MPNDKLTEIAVVLDRSGSMECIREDMVGGFAAFLAEQRAHPDPCVVSLYTFDDHFAVVYEERPVTDATLELVPRNRTALLDALGNAITLIGERLAKKAEAARPGKIIVLVITDGKENASHEYDVPAIRAKITHQRTVYNWQFAFLGANLDSFSQARHLGIPTHAALDFTPNVVGVEKLYSSLTRGVSEYRSSTGRGAALEIESQENASKPR